MTWVSCYGIISTRFTSDFIKFIKINYAVFSAFDIFISGIIEISYSNFNVGADKASFSEAGSIRYSHWNV